MFKIDDPIIHPTRGAGIITAFIERSVKGETIRYYQIEMLGETALQLFLPVEKAALLGIRRAIPSEQLPRIWEILQSPPVELPTNSRKRYRMLKEKLLTADTLQIAEIVRDIVSERQADGSLKTRDRNIYLESLNFLSGEIAAAQGVELSAARALVKGKINREQPSVKTSAPA
ncbi:MAG TPA: hypothetical protein G4N98_08730 [Thermoflexia bacterium]|nr:hypothetical protein [Thermoflexia bacterium]